MAKKATKKGKGGRRPVDDKKKQVDVYIHESKIEKLGGLEATKEKIVNFVDKEAAKKSKE